MAGLESVPGGQHRRGAHVPRFHVHVHELAVLRVGRVVGGRARRGWGGSGVGDPFGKILISLVLNIRELK